MLSAALFDREPAAPARRGDAGFDWHRSGPGTARLALLGVGTVGKALLSRLDALAALPCVSRLHLGYVANSRYALQSDGDLRPSEVLARLQGATQVSALDLVAPALGRLGPRIVVDATASEAVAERHAAWLAQGIHVVTACKLGQGTSLARWSAIHTAAARGEARYGDAATVGAGLPLLRTLRELQDGGDRIHALAGVLSGSLGWLFQRYDGMRPFSSLVRQAREAGYTEPDPREDLSGEDVRRKLLILARASGFPIEAGLVEVSSLVPSGLAALPRQDVDACLHVLDAPLRERFARAYRDGERLRFIARLTRSEDGNPRVRVGLEALAPDHPLAGGSGTDNRVAIWSDRYSEQPLVIQGPGAGAEVTAAALLDDALRIANG